MITPEQCLRWIERGTLLKVAVSIWLLFVGGIVLLAYRAYFPPNFERSFLTRHREYFYGVYAVAFYAHIITAPLVLVIGILQCSRTLRRRYVVMHERLGQAYCLMVLWAMAPGGLIMAFRSYSGWPAVAAFVLLSVLTWWFTYRGWVAIGSWDVPAHGRWMQRSFILVCSAILLRAMSAEASNLHFDPETAYAAIAWLCWLPSWLAYELFLLWQRRKVNHGEHLTGL